MGSRRISTPTTSHSVTARFCILRHRDTAWSVPREHPRPISEFYGQWEGDTHAEQISTQPCTCSRRGSTRSHRAQLPSGLRRR